jgi:hypothetical protein
MGEPAAAADGRSPALDGRRWASRGGWGPACRCAAAPPPPSSPTSAGLLSASTCAPWIEHSRRTVEEVVGGREIEGASNRSRRRKPATSARSGGAPSTGRRRLASICVWGHASLLLHPLLPARPLLLRPLLPAATPKLLTATPAGAVEDGFGGEVGISNGGGAGDLRPWRPSTARVLFPADGAEEPSVHGTHVASGFPVRRQERWVSSSCARTEA